MQPRRFWIVVFIAGLAIGRYVLPQAGAAHAEQVVIREALTREPNPMLVEVVRCATEATQRAAIEVERRSPDPDPVPDPGDGLTDDQRWEGVVAEVEDGLPTKVGAILGQVSDLHNNEPMAGVTVVATSPAI